MARKPSDGSRTARLATGSASPDFRWPAVNSGTPEETETKRAARLAADVEREARLRRDLGALLSTDFGDDEWESLKDIADAYALGMDEKNTAPTVPELLVWIDGTSAASRQLLNLLNPTGAKAGHRSHGRSSAAEIGRSLLGTHSERANGTRLRHERIWETIVPSQIATALPADETLPIVRAAAMVESWEASGFIARPKLVRDVEQNLLQLVHALSALKNSYVPNGVAQGAALDVNGHGLVWEAMVRSVIQWGEDNRHTVSFAKDAARTVDRRYSPFTMFVLAFQRELEPMPTLHNTLDAVATYGGMVKSRMDVANAV